MKHDIREVFKDNLRIKRKLPASHREDFLKKLEGNTNIKSKKKSSFIVLKVAASIAAILALVFLFQKRGEVVAPNLPKLVDKPENIEVLETKPSNKTVSEELVVKQTNGITLKEDRYQIIEQNTPLEYTLETNNKPKGIKKEMVLDTKLLVAENIDKKEHKELDTIHNIPDVKSRIIVNSDALLFSIEHSENEVLAYYHENGLSRKTIIEDIELQLQKSSLAINAEDLLTEIEYGLHKKSFKEKLLATIKLKIKELSNSELVTN